MMLRVRNLLKLIYICQKVKKIRPSRVSLL